MSIDPSLIGDRLQETYTDRIFSKSGNKKPGFSEKTRFLLTRPQDIEKILLLFLLNRGLV